MALIDREKLLAAIEHEKFMANTGYPKMHYRLKDCINHIKRFPPVMDSVPTEIVKQIQWERDYLQAFINEMHDEHEEDAEEADRCKCYCFEDMCDWKDKSPCEICRESFLHGHASGMAMRRMHVMMLNAKHLKDRVKIVRCKDCKYDEHCMTQSFVRENGDGIPYTKDFFCADGKLKMEE